jgi:hypothetical protein
MIRGKRKKRGNEKEKERKRKGVEIEVKRGKINAKGVVVIMMAKKSK